MSRLVRLIFVCDENTENTQSMLEIKRLSPSEVTIPLIDPPSAGELLDQPVAVMLKARSFFSDLGFSHNSSLLLIRLLLSPYEDGVTMTRVISKHFVDRPHHVGEYTESVIEFPSLAGDRMVQLQLACIREMPSSFMRKHQEFEKVIMYGIQFAEAKKEFEEAYKFIYSL